jgi:hypothetical protein
VPQKSRTPALQRARRRVSQACPATGTTPFDNALIGCSRQLGREGEGCACNVARTSARAEYMSSYRWIRFGPDTLLISRRNMAHIPGACDHFTEEWVLDPRTDGAGLLIPMRAYGIALVRATRPRPPRATPPEPPSFAAQIALPASMLDGAMLLRRKQRSGRVGQAKRQHPVMPLCGFWDFGLTPDPCQHQWHVLVRTMLDAGSSARCPARSAVPTRIPLAGLNVQRSFRNER